MEILSFPYSIFYQFIILVDSWNMNFSMDNVTKTVRITFQRNVRKTYEMFHIFVGIDVTILETGYVHALQRNGLFRFLSIHIHSKSWKKLTTQFAGDMNPNKITNGIMPAPI